ncbi:DUF5984 family protein [Kutzneria sp. CA-103260]|uniref:DUF5984 family protein n=1 Tax=Kutzneria sp. CA-103260 TaxID=2802641 RepID=UPI001BACE966|nr:DUF5984 family protein [Kutzneria sp. CA-103260]QUQ72257.1 hypothetical protein JJ691_100450 [Kutzneria sp. CA-103260]
MPLRFRFRLTPLDQVTPWSSEYWPHWFGLSDGTYWIELDGHRLLCGRDGGPFIDYYVCRFWEDLVETTLALFAGRTHQFYLGYPGDRHNPEFSLRRTKNRIKIHYHDRIDDITVVATVPMKQWLAALAELDREFVAAMAERLGGDPKLLAEHEQRARWVAKALP